LRTTPKILFVDDEPDLELMIKQKFRKQIRDGEMTLEFASNGTEAIDKLLKDPSIDVVFTDINMPVMDGLTFLAKIKELKIPHTKAVIVSAYGDIDKIRLAMNTGAFDFITKPIDFDDLEVTLNKAVAEVSLLKEAVEVKLQLQVAEIEKDKAILSEKFKQQFLANMSHEIRTPMNAIIGMARLAINTSLNETQQKYLDGIRQSGENLMVIINDILDFSKIEAGKLEFEEINFSPRQVLQTVHDTLRFKAEEKNLLLHTHANDDVPQHLIGDPVRLNQVILNLAGNAVKFTANGSVTISLILAGDKDGKANIRVEIKDTGIGIAEDKVGAVFDSFSQASSDTTRKFGGTGLGLSISKELVEMQGGTIGLTSKLGEGTTFWFEIPYNVGENIIKTKHEEKKIRNIDNIRILLVEDNAFNQMVATDTLQEMIPGVYIDVAENGQEALDKVSQTAILSHMKFPYHIVLMDVQMPIMDGFEATKKIRELAGTLSQIPIMALTANAIKEEVEKCKEAGMNDFVTKPFDPAVLLEKIAMLVS